MSATNSAENNFFLLFFNNTNWANVGDATGLRGSTTPGSLYVSLHTADPGETGTQTTSETSYGSYARVAVARSGAGWVVSGTSPTQAANAAALNFPTCSSGTPTLTHFGIGTASSGAGELCFKGALTAALVMAVGITPSFAIGTCKATAD